MQQGRLSEDDLSPEELEAEQALGRLSPLRCSLDFGQLRATALQRRESRRVWFWRCVSAGLAAALAVGVWPRTQGRIALPAGHTTIDMPIAHLPQPENALAVDWQSPPALLSADGNENYLQLRRRVLQRGVNGLDQPHLTLRHAAPAAQVSEPELVVERAIQLPAPRGPIFQFFRVLGNGSGI